MWIRSQDKRMLINCKCFEIISGIQDNYIIEEDTGKGILNPHLGMYSTYNKALKVLDEIQKLTFGTYIDTGVEMKWVDNQWYQMPQDDEVKENE